MTHNDAIAYAKTITRERGRIAAIRFLRRLGLTYRTAAKTVTEIQADAKWYRKIKPAR